MSGDTVTIVGCGYTGLRLARRLVADGRPVCAIVRSSRHAREIAAGGIETLRLDLDAPAVDSLPGHGSFVYMVPPPDRGDTDPRMTCWLDLLDAAPRCIVYLSTTGVYGDRGGAVVHETTPPSPTSSRGRRRLDAETRLREFAAARGTAVRILRVPGIYGPGRLPLERIASGAPVPRLGETGPGNRIHVDDLAEACRAAIDYRGEEVLFNVGDGDDASMTEYFLKVAELAGLEPPPQLPLADLLARVSPMMRSFLSESRKVDVTRMRTVLGVEPRYPSMAAGIRASLAEIRSG
jgi:nucleoside-diphosphate-sugar epimerase